MPEQSLDYPQTSSLLSSIFCDSKCRHDSLNYLSQKLGIILDPSLLLLICLRVLAVLPAKHILHLSPSLCGHHLYLIQAAIIQGLDHCCSFFSLLSDSHPFANELWEVTILKCNSEPKGTEKNGTSKTQSRKGDGESEEPRGHGTVPAVLCLQLLVPESSWAASASSPRGAPMLRHC